MSWGLALSMASTYLSGKGEADQIDKMNKAKATQFKQNTAIVAEGIGTLQERTDVTEFEATRASIRTKMHISRAAHKAEGDAAVAAAHKGTGSGKRAALEVFRPSSRVAGELITDANINLQTEFTNITQFYNDTATQMIANLNNSKPIMRDVPSTFSLLASSAMTGMNYYDSMSADGKAQFKGMFKKGEAAGIRDLGFDAPGSSFETAFDGDIGR